MMEYLKMRPMLGCAVFAVLLCLAGFYSEWAPWIGLFLIAALFLISVFCKARPATLFALIMLLPICCSLLVTGGKICRLSACDKTALSGEFIVTETPSHHGKSDSVVVKVKDAPPLQSGDKVLVRGDLSGCEMGNRISAEVLLSRSKPNKYLGGQYSEGVYITGSIKKASVIVRNGDPVLRAVRDLRAAIESRLFVSLEREEAATLSAVLIGDKTHLNDAFEGWVRTAGVSHIMAVSGLHLAIMIGLILRLTRLVTNAPVVRFFVILFTAVFLTFLCGFSKSTLRASVCLLIYAVSLLLGREHTPENTLGAAVVLLLTASPFLLFSVSFQLSVLSTLGILVCALPFLRVMSTKKPFRNRFLSFLVSGVAITVSATAFSLPVTLYTFGGTSLIGVVSNLLIVPVMTPMLMLTVGALAMSLLLEPISSVLLWLPGLLAAYVNRVIGVLGGLPFAYLYTNALENAVCVLVPPGMFLASVTLQKRQRKSRRRAANRKNEGKMAKNIKNY